jgi:transposase-like protein
MIATIEFNIQEVTNMVQRAAMSLFEFHQRFPTQKECFEHLFNTRWPDGFICPRCNSQKYGFYSNRFLYQCKDCRYQVSLTAGSIMHKTRTPLMVWFWTIFLVACDKRGHSALSISKELKISYWVAWTLLQKIRRAMAEQDRRYGLKGIVELDDAYFGGTEEVAKRGRGTTQSKVLVAVSTDVEKKHAGFVKMKVAQKLDKHTVNKFVEENIEPGSKIQTDDLAIYNSLNDLGVKHEQYPIVSGEKPLPWVHTIISNAKTFCLGTYHRFGRKHLQAYLDEFCYRFNRRFWEDQLFDRLLAACINCEHITYAELTQ